MVEVSGFHHHHLRAPSVIGMQTDRLRFHLAISPAPPAPVHFQKPLQTQLPFSPTACTPFTPIGRVHAIRQSQTSSPTTIEQTPIKAFAFTLKQRCGTECAQNCSIQAHQSHPFHRRPVDVTSGASNPGRSELAAYNGKGRESNHDQWSVPGGKELHVCSRLRDLTHRVMCWGCCTLESSKHPMSFLGDFGHLERFSAWSHLIFGIAFFTYAIVCTCRFTEDRTSESWAIAGAFSTSATFFSSTIYHVTTPDAAISVWTRQLDFLTIYTSLSINSVADLAAVTRGFVNIPVVSIIDIPLAASCLAIFFLYRRSWLTREETLITEFAGCTLETGLFRVWHGDGEHGPLRQAGSLAIAIFVFSATPAILSQLDGDHAGIILALQISAFSIVLFGMVLDSVLVWPDRSLARGAKIPCVSFKYCGCGISSHGIWHVLAGVAAVMAVVAREYALAVA